MKQEVVREQGISTMPEAPTAAQAEDPKKRKLAVELLEARIAPSGSPAKQVGWGC